MSDSKYVNTTEIANHFGVAKATVLAMVRSGEIPEGTYVRTGRVFRFNLTAIENHLLTTAPTAEEDGAPSHSPEQLELPFEDLRGDEKTETETEN
jgi:excisionase family DNA binding protein